MNINFRLGERKDTDILHKFFSQKSLDYKGFNLWLPKALEEYRYEIKQAMLGFYENVLVSALMFQDCKHMKGFKELKSGRTLKEFSRRYFLSFEARQVESISREEGKLGVICDARSDNEESINLLKSNGYIEVARADLYNEGYEDVVMIKPLIESFSFR